MLSTLGVLPIELKRILIEYADMPECVGTVDQFELDGIWHMDVFMLL